MIQTLSFFDTLRFNLLYSIPNYLQGLFTRRRLWVSLWTKVQVDRFAIRFASHLRKKYGSKYFFTRVGNARTVVILDPDGIKHVLANSPVVYGDGDSKHKGMSHFQPNAVTISRGDEWKDRRRFNEAVLKTGHPVHDYADRFLEVISTATEGMLKIAGDNLSWQHFDELFEQIAAGVIFAENPHESRPAFEQLQKLMRESNRVSGLKKSKYFDGFYDGIRSRLRLARPRSLASLCAKTPSTDETRVENQIPHWMFAIRETLATNTARALALIVSHPQKEQRVRDELVGPGRLTPEIIRNWKYLEGCVQEAMRLWPTTPFIAREVVVEDVLEGSTISPGTQVLILNAFNHRDRESSADADAFCPEQWLDGPPDLPFNHLSSGPQVCAGKDLALFIAKAVIGTLLRNGHYALRKPSLHPQEAIPPMYNYFRLSFRRK